MPATTTEDTTQHRKPRRKSAGLALLTLRRDVRRRRLLGYYAFPARRSAAARMQGHTALVRIRSARGGAAISGIALVVAVLAILLSIPAALPNGDWLGRPC